MKLCIITTLRATLPETVSFVNYHVNIGFDHLFLFFDDPDDPAIPLIEKNEHVTIIRCSQEHWKQLGCEVTDRIEERQKKNADLALDWSRKANFDWVTHIDSDELIYTTKPIKSILTNLPSGLTYLWLPAKESVPQKMDCHRPFQEISLFKVLPSREHNNYKGINKDAYYRGEFFRGHKGKSIVRMSANIKSLAIHRPVFTDSKYSTSSEVPEAGLLHFDCYCFESWYMKWLRRLDGSAKAGGRMNRLQQFDYFSQLYNKGEIQALKAAYKEMYFISKEVQKRLKKEGMLQTITIDEELFKP